MIIDFDIIFKGQFMNFDFDFDVSVKNPSG